MKFPLKEVLILLYLAAGYGAVGERIASLGASVPLILYLGLFVFLTAALALAAYVKSLPLRLVYGVVLAGSAFFLDSAERIMGEPLSYDLFISLLDSIGFAGDAVGQHSVTLLVPALSSVLLLVGIALPPRRSLPVPAAAIATAPLAGVALLAAILFARGGEGARGLPGAFTPLSYSSLDLYETVAGDSGPRQAVAFRPRGSAPSRDIVLIIDESIVGDYLDINDPAGVRSGLAGPRPGIAVRNYGLAAAVTNCSVGANVTLRHGGTRADYRRINATLPSLWDYARRAGFRTAYIDSQRTGGELQNLMDADELKAIDAFVQFDRVRVRDRDMAAADRLAALTRDDRADFVIVNKVGAHFPIHDKYPDSFLRHRPALPRGGHEGVSDTGSRDGFGGTAADWERYRNAYRNTLLWNVGAFFDRLLAGADLSRATILYTSDHGQDLHEDGSPGLNTHCSGDPLPAEGLVPLVVVEGAALKTLDWDRNLGANRGRASHYQVFPTLLALMGYDPGDVAPLYGGSLVDRSRDPMTFNTRFNARLGREPAWTSVAPAP